MKRVLTFTIMILIALVLLSVSVNAAEVLEAGNATDLVNAVAEGGKIKLNANIVLETTIDITKEVELDLNGFSIIPSSTLKSNTGLIIVQNGGALTINDSFGTGKISGGTGNDNLYAAVQVTKKGVSTEKSATLIVNGGLLEGYYYGIVGNGSRHNTNITINGGTIKGIYGPGIYHPQNGIITINGGTIEGTTGIEIRAGKLILENGTITGTYKPTEILPNGNGTTTEGAGIAIAQHTTKLDTSVVVNGGTINGFTPLYQSNPQKNDEDAIAKVSIEINGGTFNNINEGTEAIYSENKTGFIKGGGFSSDVTKYLDDGLICKNLWGLYYNVMSAKFHKITVEDVEGGTVKVDKETAQYGDTVKLAVTVNEGYKLKSLEISDGNCGDSLMNKDSFIYSFGSDVVITPEFEKLAQEIKLPENVANAEKVEEVLLETLKQNIANDAELAAKIEGKNIEVKVNLTEATIDEDEKDKIDVAANKKIENIKLAKYIEITITINDADTKEFIDNLEKLKESITFTVEIPTDLPEVEEGFERIYYIVRDHNGVIEILDTKASEDGKTLSFASNKFSTYAIAYTDVKVKAPVEEGKDETPKTGSTDVVLFASATVAIISLAGIVTVKKYVK